MCVCLCKCVHALCTCVRVYTRMGACAYVCACLPVCGGVPVCVPVCYGAEVPLRTPKVYLSFPT